ncbi:hypothetical protein [Bacillus suaedae]|uniref:DUF3976 domain-containing protein n=1 Tax=Halalkalibacter suaedae TaxID=2822140 RepID=A0A940WZ06_9BACI|nr:hypothetical protein [Bacillus suaedae]MBP3953552.1 hypothetical protein [Bacillus suaedae]
MEIYILLAVVVVGMFVSIMITQNHRDSNKALTKQGYFRLLILFGVIFLSVLLLVIVE